MISILLYNFEIRGTYPFSPSVPRIIVHDLKQVLSMKKYSKSQIGLAELVTFLPRVGFGFAISYQISCQAMSAIRGRRRVKEKSVKLRRGDKIPCPNSGKCG